jgi:hypothetical protein
MSRLDAYRRILFFWQQTGGPVVGVTDLAVSNSAVTCLTPACVSQAVLQARQPERVLDDSSSDWWLQGCHLSASS